MNKKVLSALLFGAMVASTGTFTSCIDNDEPAGIEELRGATAELIKAKAAVEQAKVQSEAANAALIQANAKIAEAQAAYEQARADKVKAETELAVAKGEAEIAKLKQELAEAEMKMELAAKQQEVAMKKAEADLLGVEQAYLEAESALAILKATMTEAESEKVSALKNALASAKDKLSAAEEDLFDANKELYSAMLNKEKGNRESTLKLKLSLAENKLAAAQAEEAEAKALAEKDVEATDWEKEAAELRAKAKKLSATVLDSLNIEAEKIAANNKTLFDEVLATSEARRDVLDAEYPTTKYVNKTIEGNQTLRNAIGNRLRNGHGATYADGVFTIGEDDETFKAEGEFSSDDDVLEITSTDLDGRLDVVKNWIEELGKLSLSENDKVLAEIELEGYEEAVETVKEAYDEAVAKWGIAVKAYKGVATAVPTEDFETAVAAYNTKLEALKTAVNAYNTAYDETYQTAYNEAVAKTVASFEWDEVKTQAKTDLGEAVEAKCAALETLNGTDYATMIAAVWGYYTVESTATEAEKTAMAEKLAKAKSSVSDAIEIYKIRNKETLATTGDGAGKEAVNAASASDKTLGKANKTITDAEDALKASADKAGSYASLIAALDNYVALANSPYSQVLTADAKKITIAAVTGVTDKVSATTWFTKKDGKFTVVRTAVAEEKVTAMTATKVDESLAKNALLTESNATFGLNKKLVVAPTEAEVREAGNGGAMGALLNAQDELQEAKNKIAQNETLATLISELTVAKNTLASEINAVSEAAKVAQAAYVKKKEAYDALFEGVNKAQEEAKHLVATYNRIAKELETAVAKYYAGLDFKYEDIFGAEHEVNAGNATDLAKWFDDWYETAQWKTVNAQGNVQEAQVNLKEYQEGKYDDVAMATRDVEKAQAAYDEAKAEYDAALEALNNLLAVIAGK